MTGTVAGVLLAAGTGSRFASGNKLLTPVLAGDRDEKAPVVRHAARTLLEAPVDPCVTVLGHEAERVRDAVADLPTETAENPDYERGQATSVARGVAWARDRDADAAVFALGDMPWVSVDTYRALVTAWREREVEIVVPVHDGRRGNPVLFGALHFDALAAVDGDRGGRALFAEAPVARVSVDDSGIHRDVDRVTDLTDD